MSQQETNTFGAIITTGVALTIAIIIFYLPSVIAAPNQTILAAVDIVHKPDVKKTKHKKTDYQQPRRASPSQKRLYKQSKRKLRNGSNRVRISGYRGKTFVYGEVIPLKNGKLQGFIYHPKDSKTYVYGDQSKDTMNLYDTSGNLYQMLR